MDRPVQSTRPIEDDCSDNGTAMFNVVGSRDRAITLETPETSKEFENQGLESTKGHQKRAPVSMENVEIRDTDSCSDPSEELIENRKCERLENSVHDSSPIGRAQIRDGHALTIENECRICQIGGDEDLISPCKCSGSAKWVHQSCIVKWFQVSDTSACELCAHDVFIKKSTKPPHQWRLPRGDLGPCSRVDLWYLFVTVFSISTIIGFGIFHLLVKSKEPETTAVFGAIYALCGIMILLRIHYFYVWFTRRSAFWRKWQRLNKIWKVAFPGTVLNVSEVATMV